MSREKLLLSSLENNPGIWCRTGEKLIVNHRENWLFLYKIDKLQVPVVYLL